ncbi:MAG: hypothetical protein K2Y32_11725 [Candidatus Obscuribacterales bacterium]|nr:hypothetical protein [Candidatus Obscuribacterales bacterium]
MQQISYRNWNHYRRGRGLALWAKILIGLGVLSLIGLLVVGGLLWSLFGDFADPKAVEKAANSIVTMSPLPANLKYAVGKNLMGAFQFAAINDEAAKDTYMLMSYKMEASKKITAKDFIEALKGGKEMPSSAAATGAGGKLDVSGEGEFDIAGTKVPYVYGKTQAKGGTTAASLIAACAPEGEDRMVLIIAQQNGDTINIDRVKSFVSLITSIKPAQ